MLERLNITKTERCTEAWQGNIKPGITSLDSTAVRFRKIIALDGDNVSVKPGEEVTEETEAIGQVFRRTSLLSRHERDTYQDLAQSCAPIASVR